MPKRSQKKSREEIASSLTQERLRKLLEAIHERCIGSAWCRFELADCFSWRVPQLIQAMASELHWDEQLQGAFTFFFEETLAEYRGEMYREYRDPQRYVPIRERLTRSFLVGEMGQAARARTTQAT